MTMMSNLVQNHILHWFKPVTFYPNLPKYTFYSEGIVNFMPTSDGEVEKLTAPVCRLVRIGIGKHVRFPEIVACAVGGEF